MFNLWLRLALFLSVLLTALALLPRLLPYNRSEPDAIRALLFPPQGCVLPQTSTVTALCPFGTPGIQPGITTLEEAMRILDAHPWVQRVHLYYGMAISDAVIFFDWNGQQPAALVNGGQVWVRENRVNSIEITTRLAYGDWWALLPTPDSGYSGRSSIVPPHMLHYAVYYGGLVELQLMPRCPLTPAAFWSSPALLRISATASRQMSAYALPAWGGCG